MRDDIYNPIFVADLFDRCAARYRRWSAVASFGMVWLWRRTCVNRLSAQAQVARIEGGQIRHEEVGVPVIVDLMAGTGEVWPHLRGPFPRARILAIDISEQMHKTAVARLDGPQAGRIRHLAADALTHELEPGSADFVISTFGLKTCSAAQHQRLARQVAQVLKPGGAFAMIEASDPRGWWLRPLYRAYLGRVLPLIERLFLRGAQDFAMIGAYTRAFGDCSGFANALRAEGLRVTEASHVFGCATSVAGIKPRSAP